MAAARLAAALLVALATALTAQNTSTNQVVITVIDTSGALIPGAHVGIVRLPDVIPNDGDWLHYASTAPEQATTQTDGHGETTVGLAPGIYAISIAAPGFKRYFKRIEIRDESNQSLRATLAIDSRPIGPVVTMEPAVTLELEPTSLNVFIPLEPLLTVTSVHRARRR
jgi:hypothetical protein